MPGKPSTADRAVPSKAAMGDYFHRAGLKVSTRQLDQFWAYHQFLRRANAELNLTRLHAFESMVVKHYIDCALISTLTRLPSPLVDIGSGAGLPGIPLKIMSPPTQMILAEGRKNRVAFLNEAIAELGLEGIEVHSGRIYPDTIFDPPLGGAITRAVESIGETLERISGCVGLGGRALFMKGPDGSAEIAPAISAHPDWRLEKDIAYDLPVLGDARRLIVLERATLTPRRAAPPEITSRDNAFFKKIASLTTSRGQKKAGEYLASGAKLIEEAVADQAGAITAWIGTSGQSAPPPALASAHWVVLSKELFKEVDVLGTNAPLVSLKRPELSAFDPNADWPKGCTLILPLGDPENVGAALRSAAALGAARVVLTEEAASPYLPRAVRAAAGAVWKLPLLEGPALEVITAPKGIPLFALDVAGEEIDTVRPPERYGLVVGLEGQGLPAALRKRVRNVSIPMKAGVDSLNAAVSTALALWSWR